MNDSDALLAHVPELRSPLRRVIAASVAVGSFAAATAAMVAVDSLWPSWTALGQVITILAGFGWAGQFFWRRKEYKARWGAIAYRNAFARHMLPGLPVMFAAIAHNAYVPGEPVLNGWWAPITSMLALYLFVVGALLYVRAYAAFGVDNLSMLYVYFPSEGRLVDSSIYSVLRHPAYAGVVRIGLAFGLWRGTGFSIFFGLFMPIGLTLWLRLVEEPELIERFGESYAEYRRKVPAFWPRLRDMGTFWRFLITGQ
jgi:protein-S-isoprenylcysteine O-methyltransferase Ste14